jgi:hypothetical protein
LGTRALHCGLNDAAPVWRRSIASGRNEFVSLKMKLVALLR